MNEYYGISPSSDFFAHYGVRGMKWGIRKAIDRSNSKPPLSSAYLNAQRKLKVAIDKGNSIGAYAYKQHEKSGKHIYYTLPKANLKRAAIYESARAEAARQRMENSFLGRHGFGHTAKAYKEAHARATEATSKYYNSLTKKEYAKLRRQHIG